MWFIALLSTVGVPLVIYLLFAVPALYYLRTRYLDDTARAVWAFAIIAVPVMGAVAFATLQPGIRRS
jgi:hypothetical protein